MTTREKGNHMTVPISPVAEPEPEKASETARAAITQEEFRRLEAVIVQQREHIKSLLAPFRSAVANALVPSDRDAALLTLRQERDTQATPPAPVDLAEVKKLLEWGAQFYIQWYDGGKRLASTSASACAYELVTTIRKALAALDRLVPPAPDRGEAR